MIGGVPSKFHKFNFLRDRYGLYAFPEYKCYQLLYDKRVIDPSTFQTYPFGYQEAV